MSIRNLLGFVSAISLLGLIFTFPAFALQPNEILVIANSRYSHSIELAKYYEWHAHDLPEAQSWAKEALLCLTHWPEDWRRDQLWSEIEHRLARLARKIGT